MNIWCSVACCSRLSLWHFESMHLCESHWKEWCWYTRLTLLENVKQPIMEDWIAAVGAWEAGSLEETEGEPMERIYRYPLA
jgi:hypothetical protein